MVKVKLIHDTVVNGGVWPAGSVVEVDEDEARSLLRDGLAAETPPPTPTPSPALPHLGEHKMGEGEKKVKHG